MKVTSIRDLLLIVVVTVLSRQVSARTYGLKNSLIQADANHDFDFGDGTLLDDEDMQHDSSGNGEILEEGSTGDGAQYLVKLTIVSNEVFSPDLSTLSSSELESYKNDVKYQVFHLLGADSSQYDVEVTDLSAFEHDVGRTTASMTLTLGVLVTPVDVFKKIYDALLSGRLGNLRVSADGFVFKSKDDDKSCPSSMGKEPSHLPHVGDAHASLLIGQPFRCFGWLKSVQYYRGDPYAEAFLGLWHNETETTFVLRNKLKLMPDSVGIHSVTISDQWLVSTGDYLGIHYPRASRSGAVSYAKTSDNLFDEQNFYQAAILPIYEEDIFPNAPISVNLEDIQFEPRLFAIQGDYTPEYTHQGKRCSDDEFECLESKTCISNHLRCNRHYDCTDGSDELDCEMEEGFVPTWVEPKCSDYEFQCREGTCIADVHRCDGYVQCPDGSDEIDCGRCPEDSFYCGDGYCIDLKRRCDGIRDCSDFSDEADCSDRCNPSDFVCQDNKQCVPLSSRCDRKYDCSDGSDEYGCDVPAPCRANEFTCSNGQCIPDFNRCDGQYHCSDGSDETSCQPTCSSEEFQCGDGRCVSLRQRCDGRTDCSDGTDEFFCPTAPVGCSSEEFQCQNGRCIPLPYRCDGRPDCEDQSDELYCPTVPAGCSSEEFQCQNGRCIPLPYRCDGRPDCEDQSDELYCPTPSGRCYPNEFQCGDGTCIDDRFRCNSRIECADGSDEQGCAPVGCADDEFQCQDRCIPISLRCDGRNDCPDGMDELFCPTLPPTCSPDEFRCYDGRCIPDYFRCNGRSECPDGSDEQNCAPTLAPCDENVRFKCWDGTCIDKYQRCDKRYDCSDRSDEYQCELTASPAELRLRTGATATFVCLAKSPTNLRWFRRDTNSLPYNARVDQTGRITISDVRLEEAGEYVCSDERGFYDASVVLSVEDIVGPSILPTPRPGYCRAGESMCRNGQCIPINYVCDGDFDCLDKSDEENCAMRDTCEPNEFRCANSKCILQIWRCDGDSDCGENDQSDELGCDTNLTSTGCRANEFKCQDVPQCIPAGYHCDAQTDCQDHSDEKGCIPPSVPVRMISEKAGHQGDEIVLECEARGIPAPLIIWRLNWGFVGPAPRVTATMERVTPVTWGNEMVTVKGKLVIKDLRKEDEGAYSCEAINSRGSIFATPDTIVYLLPPKEVHCRPPMFNSEARNPSECLRCWCSELTKECTSSTLYNSLRRRAYDIQHGSLGYLRAPLSEVNVQSFSELFDPFIGDRLTSYGGYIMYNVFYHGEPKPSDDLVAVVLTGANNVKLYSFHHDAVQPNVTTHVRIPLRENQWYLDPLKNRPASRADLLEVLKDVKSAQVRFVFSQNQEDVHISDIYLSTTSDQDNMRGLANLVEVCSCPEGYTGTSCEVCAPNYRRTPSGVCESTCFCSGHSTTCDPEHGYCLNCQHNTMGWQCEECTDGYYRTTKGEECKVCPCPWHGNQPTLCRLNKEREVQCHNCSEGSFGEDCRQCHRDYLLASGICIKLEPKVCHENGTARTDIVDGVKTCTCKKNVQSPDCSKCRPNSFNLRGDNPEGCDECFCWGATSTCNLAESYEWYSINSHFTDTGNLDDDVDNFEVTENKTLEAEDFPLTTKFRPGFVTFFTRLPKTYEFLSWELPEKYLENKLTSYGGFLNYTVYYETGNNNRLTNWPDVVLTGNNGLTLYYKNPNFVVSGPPQRVSVPLRENGWTTKENEPLNRAQFMSVLSNLRAFKIRARYTTDDFVNGLSEVSLDVARESNTGRPKASFIEQCTCPSGYAGLSCETCQADYKEKVISPVEKLCSKCDCYGHGDCNEEEWCPVCQHNTEGRHCEKCKAGFYGDATTGGEYACRPCECPIPAVDGREVSTCEEDKSTNQVKCRTCPEGHTGERCERCLPGYEGNPWVKYGFCKRVIPVTPTASPYQPVIDQVDPNPTVEVEKDLTLFCNARGAEPLTLQWVRGENQPLSERATQQPDGRLVIRNIRPEDAGVYVCIVRNNYGTTELVVTVYVTGIPGVQLQIQPSHPEPMYGTDYSLLCSVKNAVNYVLTWTRDPMPLEGRTLTVENTLHFKTLTERDNGRYVCTVYDNGRTYTQYYDLTVRGEPPIQPPEKRDVTAYVDQDVALHCKVQSDYPTTVYWLRRGRTDLGPRAYVEADNTLRIRGIQHEDQDTYVCVAENIQGKKEHHINIFVKDSVIVNFQDVYRTKVGENVNLACEVAEGSRYVIYWVRNHADPLGPRASQSTTGDARNILNIRGIQSEDAGNYTCVVRNQQGEEIRAVAYIQVEPDDRLPKIGPGPSFIPIPYGSNAILSCVAQSPVAYTVFWYKDGADITYLKQADNSITLTNFQQKDVGIYRCIVQNQYGQVQHEVNVTANANGNRSPQAYITHEYWKEGGRNNARLQCFASGEPSITWSRADGRPLSGKVRYEADNILVIPDLTPGDAGDYVCKALYYPYGDAQANFYLNGITNEDKPIFATGARLRYVKAGDTATFECHLGPDLDTSFNPIIWFRRDRRRQDHRYTDDGEGQLVIHDVNPSDAGKIVCSVYISEDEADEDEFELIIEDDSSPDRTPSAIIGSPYETVAVEGQPVEIKCFVKGSPKPSIYWTHNGLPLYQYLTQDGNVYIQQAKQADEGEYVCHARNQIGTASSRIFLNVQNPNYPVSVSAPPKIVEREDLTLSCRTDSYIKVEGIDWAKLKGRLPPGAEQTREEFSSSLKIPECRKEDEGRYVCTIYFVDGGKEMAYYTFKLAHEDRNTGTFETRGTYLEISPKSLEFEVGSTAVLTCTVHNVGPSLPAITWSRPGQALSGSHRITGPTLTLFDLNAEDAGTYLCSAQTDEGYKEAYSEIIIKSHGDSGGPGEDPVLVLNTEEVYELEEGMPLHLECTYTKIDSHPNHVIRWISPLGQATPSANGFTSLSIDRVDKSHEGRYTCHVQGEIGEFRKFVDFRVAEHRESSLITIYPPSLRIAVGQSSQLQCMAQGREYQWFFQFGDTDSGWLPIGHIKNAEPVGNTLRFIDLTQRNSGSYKCITTVESEGRYLEVEATAHLEVLSPPVISIVPSSVHLRPGEYLRLECRADGSQPIVFQWSRDSLVPLPAHAIERQGVLEIQAVRESDAGKYFCSARNDIGTAENVAEVTVLSAPTVMVSPRTLIQEVGSTAEFRCQASGSPPPQIKWSKEIGNLPEQHSITTDSLILYNVQLQDRGNYICSAFNEAGQNRGLVFLEVTGGETNGQGIQTKYEQARLGDSVEINCEPSTDYPNIHWLKSNSDLPPKVVIDGSTLVIPSVEESDEGTYKCFATHESGVYYAQVILTVLVPPTMAEQHSVKTTSLGSAAQLVCEARGNPRPQFTWFKRNGEVPRKSLVNDNVLSIPDMESGDFGEYVCQAQNDYGQAELVFLVESGHFIPYFIQNPLSYLTLPATRNNERSLSLSFSLRTLSMEGLVLLYGGPNLQEGFVSLGLKDSRLQATFFDGRQTHVVEGGFTRLEEWTEVEFKVGDDGASLRVDFETQVLPGSYSVFPYSTYDGLVYLGGVEQSLAETVAGYTGLRDGLNGCINKLSIDGRSVDIGSQTTGSHSVKDCPVCNHDHCKNGGACHPADNPVAFECRCLPGYSGFACETSAGLCTEGSCGARGQCINQQCVCPLGLSGSGCSEGYEVDLYFTGKTFLGVPLYGARPDYFNASLNFMVDPSTAQESIIFYVSEHPDGSGQFFTLYFVPETTSTGYLTFAFRVNQVVHSMRSSQVRMGEDVTANVMLRDGVFHLFVNEEFDGQESSEDLRRFELRLNTYLFLGGLDESFTEVCCGFGRDAFFRGQINEVRINESPFNLRLYPVHHSEFYFGEGFGEGVLHTNCEVHCQNGGTCYKNAVGLDECHCPLGFSGELCETRIVLRQSVEFSGEGFLEFSMDEYQHRHSKSVEFNLVTTQRYGLVFWQSSRDSSTHISMGLEDGKLVMKNMLLGRQFEIKSNVDVSDGLKHHVYVTWGDGFVRLTVDGYDTVEKELDFDVHDAGNFFLGGVRDYGETRGSYRAGFEGCVSNLNFGNGAEGYPDEVSLSRMALDGKNAHVCSIDDSI